MIISLDVETSGLDWQDCVIHLVGYRLDRKGPVIYAETTIVDNALSVLLSDPSNTLCGHNIKFDTLVLSSHGYTINCALEDTRILAYLNWPTLESHGLKFLVNNKLGLPITELTDLLFKPLKKELEHFTQYIDQYYSIDDQYVRKDLLKKYHEQDVLNIDRLYSKLSVPDWFKNVEMPLTRILYEAELYGCPLDRSTLILLWNEYSKRAKSLLDELIRSVGVVGETETFNPNSPKQLQEVLKKRGYNLDEICDKTPKGAYAVGKELLKTLSFAGDQFAKNMLNYRKFSKILSTYIEPFLKGIQRDGRLHGSINQAGSEDIYGDGAKGTNTGRLSSSRPNLQNIPSRTKEGKEVRKVFIPSKDCFMFDTDLSQIEPRLVAHFSQAPKLIYAYANGLDTHGLFAKDIFGRDVGKDSVERFIGKSSWLATVYGCSYKKLLTICEGFTDGQLSLDVLQYMEDYGKLDPKQKKRVDSDCGKDAQITYAKWMYFKNVQDQFERTNPEIFAWRQNHIDRTKRMGYVVTIGGRLIRIDGLDSRDWATKFSAERQAVNYLIQGSAADIMKLILVRMDKDFIKKGYGRIFATIHDEVLGEMFDPKHIDLIRDIMENTVKLRNVQIKADTKLVKSWGEK